MLGLTLCYKNEQKFNSVASNLGDSIKPFSTDFHQARGDYKKNTQALLDFTLKACIVASVVKGIENVISFAKEHNYHLVVD